MSTGAECIIYEKEPRKWYYDLQAWPYGETPDYDTYGPFGTFKAAEKHLDRNHANPGGHSIHALPDCPHDLISENEFNKNHPFDCDRCGDSFKEKP